MIGHLRGVDGPQQLGEVSAACAQDDPVCLHRRALARQGHVWGKYFYIFTKIIFHNLALLTCEVIILPECAEGLSVLLLIVIPPEEGILNIFLGF